MSREKPAWPACFLPAPSPTPCWGWTILERVSLLLWKEWKRNIILTFYGKPRLFICSWVGYVFLEYCIHLFLAVWPWSFYFFLTHPPLCPFFFFFLISRMREPLTRMTLVAIPFKGPNKITSRCRGPNKRHHIIVYQKQQQVIAFSARYPKWGMSLPFTEFMMGSL